MSSLWTRRQKQPHIRKITVFMVSDRRTAHCTAFQKTGQRNKVRAVKCVGAQSSRLSHSGHMISGTIGSHHHHSTNRTCPVFQVLSDYFKTLLLAIGDLSRGVLVLQSQSTNPLWWYRETLSHKYHVEISKFCLCLPYQNGQAFSISI